MKYKLYGDGVHDDAPAIQELLDSGRSLVYLPAPEKNYLIGRTLLIHSGQELRLDRFTLIRLAAGSNCTMLENAGQRDWDRDICVSGGIWDMDHSRQWPNPYHFANPVTGLLDRDLRERAGFDCTKRLYFDSYCGHCLLFNSIRGFTLRDMTIRNPVVYGAQLAFIEDFTVENICFDYTEGSPKLWNMDGVHFEGGCRNGLIRNLKGACHDDLVALTADDDIHGPIDNIVVDGIWAEGSHSAVRLLSYKTPVTNIRISNIFGTYYVYCINISKYHGTPEDRGIYENIVIDNVCASICPGTADVPGNYEPLIVVKPELRISSLVLSNIYRKESVCPTPTIGIGRDTEIGSLTVRNARQQNLTGKPFPFLSSAAEIGRMTLSEIDCGGDELLENTGRIMSRG